MYLLNMLILHCRVRLLQVGSRTFAIQAREAKVAGTTTNIPYTNVKKTRPAKILYKCSAVLNIGTEYLHTSAKLPESYDISSSFVGLFDDSPSCAPRPPFQHAHPRSMPRAVDVCCGGYH
jgi:hypothetical protein